MDLSFLQHPIEPAFLIPKNPFWTRPVLLGTMTQDGFFPVAEWRDAAQREYYAGWEAFDVALSQSSPRTLRVQQQCEITDLERLWRL